MTPRAPVSALYRYEGGAWRFDWLDAVASVADKLKESVEVDTDKLAKRDVMRDYLAAMKKRMPWIRQVTLVWMRH